MKLKRTVLLTAGIVALGLLLGASAAQAEPIVIVDGDTATHIQNLDVEGTLYNVAFLRTSGDDLYGDPPVFDFPDELTVKAAKVAAVLALNDDNRATRAGPSAEQSVPDWGIGYELEAEPSGRTAIKIQNGSYLGNEWQLWIDADIDIRIPGDPALYADFTLSGPPPPPVDIGGSVSGLTGSGLVLKNNGTDDLSITGDGPFTFDTPLTPGNSYNVTVASQPTSPGQTCIVENGSGTVPTTAVTDVAVTCVEVPVPVTIGGNITGLVVSGLVLQNTGRDDETITEDGPFTFDTSQTPGTFYDVTVAANPTNPGQTCIVANGSGEVPTEDVTDVEVTCAAPGSRDLVKAAAEGDTLPDGTVLTLILKDAGVAINADGQVAFGGRDDDGTDAAFTQAGKAAAEGEILPDGTVLSSFRAPGELAISGVQSDERVAFHGQDDNNTGGVFTQARRVAAEGDTLADGTTLATLDEIDAAGKVAINNFDQVAFHGKIETEGAITGEKFRAVFISDGRTTQVAAREGNDPPVGPPLAEILESGGVAISDFDEVAFHGRVVDPGFGGDTLKAVFTTDGPVAREASVLPDGNTLDDINADGGVAINFFGEVAFHGSVLDPGAGSDSVKAVLTGEAPNAAEVVVKEGDTLPDGTTVDEINVHSGVAINVYGDVVFHGRTGGVKALFTQHGLVAKVGDNLNDGTTLKDIKDNGGVAVKPYGFEAAFHGVISVGDPGAGVDAVLVGQSPVAEGDALAAEGDYDGDYPVADGEEMFSE